MLVPGRSSLFTNLYNTTAIDVFKEAKKDLIKRKEEYKNG